MKPTAGQIGITVLGATGSIGVNTLDVISRYPDNFNVIALTGYSQTKRMFELCQLHKPRFVVMVSTQSAELLRDMIGQTDLHTQVLSGEENLDMVASLSEVHYVMAAIVGAAGLKPTLAAARSGKRILLANKEALVMSGPIFMDAVKANNATLLPIDSEHNAIFQCMPWPQASDRGAGVAGNGHSVNEKNSVIRKILLTASGGPFRNTAVSELEHITPEQACAHPVWSMGKKISVDSATMMNKGLEVIEACWLFDTSPEKIQVVIHPQSVIHSMVEYIDGSVLAQLGNPDMRTPIAHALAWPQRIESGVEPMDLFKIARLEFEEPDLMRFPCLKLAIEAGKTGGTAPTVLNAANEVAVEAFLNKKLPFTGIANVVEGTLDKMNIGDVDSLETVLEIDTASRGIAAKMINDFRIQVH